MYESIFNPYCQPSKLTLNQKNNTFFSPEIQIFFQLHPLFEPKKITEETGIVSGMCVYTIMRSELPSFCLPAVDCKVSLLRSQPYLSAGL